jgi:solute carrier family 50 protein (sugar transporter)
MMLDGIIGTAFASRLGDAMNLRLRVASVALTVVYLAVLVYSQGRRGLATTGKTVAMALAAAAAVLTALQLVEPERRQAVLGTVSTATGWLFAASPLFTLRNMVRVKDGSSISLPLALALTVTALAWATYGALIDSPWIMWPNVVTTALALTWCASRGRGRG